MMEMVEDGAWDDISNGTEKVHDLSYKGAVCPDNDKFQRILTKAAKAPAMGPRKKPPKRAGISEISNFM